MHTHALPPHEFLELDLPLEADRPVERLEIHERAARAHREVEALAVARAFDPHRERRIEVTVEGRDRHRRVRTLGHAECEIAIVGRQVVAPVAVQIAEEHHVAAHGRRLDQRGLDALEIDVAVDRVDDDLALRTRHMDIVVHRAQFDASAGAVDEHRTLDRTRPHEALTAIDPDLALHRFRRDLALHALDRDVGVDALQEQGHPRGNHDVVVDSHRNTAPRARADIEIGTIRGDVHLGAAGMLRGDLHRVLAPGGHDDLAAEVAHIEPVPLSHGERGIGAGRGQRGQQYGRKRQQHRVVLLIPGDRRPARSLAAADEPCAEAAASGVHSDRNSRDPPPARGARRRSPDRSGRDSVR